LPSLSQLPSRSQQKEIGDGADDDDDDDGSVRSVSDQPVGHDRERCPVVRAWIDDSPVSSIGLAAARAMEKEPEKERRRSVARKWFAKGVAARCRGRASSIEPDELEFGDRGIGGRVSLCQEARVSWGGTMHNY
jgi:hypothetical protein